MRVAAVDQLEDLERAQLGIDEPVEAHAERRVLRELLDAIAPLVARRRRHHFDRDARRHANEPTLRRPWAAREEDERIGDAPAVRADRELTAGAPDDDA